LSFTLAGLLTLLLTLALLSLALLALAGLLALLALLLSLLVHLLQDGLQTLVDLTGLVQCLRDLFGSLRLSGSLRRLLQGPLGFAELRGNLALAVVGVLVNLLLVLSPVIANRFAQHLCGNVETIRRAIGAE
jgi:hypothetical protein